MNADSEQSMLSIGKLMDIPKKKTFAYPFPSLSLSPSMFLCKYFHIHVLADICIMCGRFYLQ